MTAAILEDLPSFSSDFTPVISDHSVDVFVGHIKQVRAAEDKGGMGHRVGTFTVEVAEVFSHHTVKPGSQITIKFEQDLHPEYMKRGGENPWNALKIAEGGSLLLACKSTDGHTCQPLAVLSADPAHAADVDAIRQAYKIEGAHGDDRLLLLGHALESPSPVLLSYSLHALGERNLAGPEQAVHLMSFALVSTSVPAANREEIGRGLVDVFGHSGLSDGNRTNILGALAHAMVDSKQKPQQAVWAALLRACLMSRTAGDDAHRYALVKNVTVPPADQVIQTLTALQHDMTDEPDAEQRALLGRMAHIWQIAKR